MLQDRCRPPPPACIRDADCPSDTGVGSLGMCILASQTCSTGCASSANCVQGYYCAGGSCTQQETCVQAGGATLACNLQQFCCGETNSLSPCPSGVSDGQCYDAPNPPWCGTCSPDGSAVTTPTGSTRPLPSVCEGGKMWHSCDPNLTGQCPRGWGCRPGPTFCKVDGDCGGSGSCGMVSIYGQTVMACVCDEWPHLPIAALHL